LWKLDERLLSFGGLVHPTAAERGPFLVTACVSPAALMQALEATHRLDPKCSHMLDPFAAARSSYRVAA
jgi:hypothetical protein